MPRSAPRRRGRLVTFSALVATRSHPAARAAVRRSVSACPQNPSRGIVWVSGSVLACRIAPMASSFRDARLRMPASGPSRRASRNASAVRTIRGRWPDFVSAEATRVANRRSSPATTTVRRPPMSHGEAHRLEREPAVVAEPFRGPGRAPDHLDLAVFDAVYAHHFRLNLAHELRAERASDRREGHLDADRFIDDRDVVDQPEVPDVHGDLRIVAGLQHLDDLIARRHHTHLPAVVSDPIVA